MKSTIILFLLERKSLKHYKTAVVKTWIILTSTTFTPMHTHTCAQIDVKVFKSSL